MRTYKELIYKGEKTIKVGGLCEVRGRNPFEDKETWEVKEYRLDNTKNTWYKLEQVEDRRNTMIINNTDFVRNFIEVIEDEDISNK